MTATSIRRLSVLATTVAACVGLVSTACDKRSGGAPPRAVGVDATRMAQARETCGAGGDAGSFRAVAREPIKVLRGDNPTKTLDGTLCVASEHAEIQTYWFWREQASGDFVDLGVNLGGRFVDGLRASPDGTYLAVQLRLEALNGVEVVDLSELIRRRTYRSIRVVASFPGGASIDAWTDAEHLTVRGDTLLSRTAHDGELALFAGTDERFSWEVATGKMEPFDDELRDPVRYYCARLLVAARHSNEDERHAQTQTRYLASLALRSLREKSGIPCLEQALARESDQSLKIDIAAALQKLRGP